MRVAAGDAKELVEEAVIREPRTASERNSLKIFHDFKLLGGKPPIETIVHAAQKHVDTVVNMMREKMEPITSQLLGMAEGTSEDDKKLLTTLAFLTALPRTVKEKSSSFLKQTFYFSFFEPFRDCPPTLLDFVVVCSAFGYRFDNCRLPHRLLYRDTELFS
ncbi:hypothetical protein HPB51_028647 [Rhipicephalus microplus]|uniref:Uncharacterized protein n=1 Tax=Rhipicephalus microplus TaxID=6941 RepID=A0A9J6CWW2_RHIMP|nr:hypothetical protein HPB51_028647 [Rhipicephalus microplus]